MPPHILPNFKLICGFGNGLKKPLYSLFCLVHAVITGAAEIEWNKGRVLPEKGSSRKAMINEEININMVTCSHELFRAVKTHDTVVKTALP